jgi:hypothetical protein
MFDFIHDYLSIIFLVLAIFSLILFFITTSKAIVLINKLSDLKRFIIPLCLFFSTVILVFVFYIQAYSYREIVLSGGAFSDSIFINSKYSNNRNNHFYSLYTNNSSSSLGLEKGLYRSYEEKNALKKIFEKNFTFEDGSTPPLEFDTSYAYMNFFSLATKKNQEINEEGLILKKEMMLESQNTAVQVAGKVLNKKLPIDVLKSLEGYSGNSAGLMMTLELLQQFGAQDLIGNNKICGTGTITAEGDVGEIGGLKMKLIMADENGFQYCLVPLKNYKDAEKILKNHQLNLQLVPVENIEEALSFLEKLNN